DLKLRKPGLFNPRDALMSENLTELERDVAAARAKLAGDLSILTAPESRELFVDALKDETWATANSALRQARWSAEDHAASLLDAIKARAAANPAAVLAIAAGIGWRVFRK